MKRKRYYICYKIDLEKLLFTVLVYGKIEKVYKITFSRNGMVEECMDKTFVYYLSNMDCYKICFHNEQMTVTDQYNIHKIFPYIPQFTNLQEFCFWYNRINTKFDYSKYTDAKILAYRILLSPDYKAEGIWNYIEDKEIHYLYCKWQDSMNISHMVLVDHEFFISDVSYWQIYQQELQMSFTFDILKIEPFVKERQHTMLDTYLNGGGKKIFSFFTAPIMNHPVELLSKAGMAKLADNIHQYQNIHMDGKTLPDIFDLPLAVLRSAEQGEDLMLYTAEDRKLLAKAYTENRAIFAEPMSIIGELWIRYYYLNAETYYGIKNAGMLLDTLRYLNQCCRNESEAYTVFGLYQNYLAYAQRIGGNYIHGLYPKDLLGAVEESVSILQMRHNEEQLLQFKKIVQSTDYQFLADDLPCCRYRIRVPETPDDIRMAGKVLHNCLKDYVSKVRERETMVAFIENKKKQNKLIGAIEVRSGKMIQALGKCNRKLSKEVTEYLQDYMQRKQIFY